MFDARMRIRIQVVVIVKMVIQMVIVINGDCEKTLSCTSLVTRLA